MRRTWERLLRTAEVRIGRGDTVITRQGKSRPFMVHDPEFQLRCSQQGYVISPAVVSSMIRNSKYTKGGMFKNAVAHLLNFCLLTVRIIEYKGKSYA